MYWSQIYIDHDITYPHVNPTTYNTFLLQVFRIYMLGSRPIQVHCALFLPYKKLVEVVSEAHARASGDIRRTVKTFSSE